MFQYKSDQSTYLTWSRCLFYGPRSQKIVCGIGSVETKLEIRKTHTLYQSFSGLMRNICRIMFPFFMLIIKANNRNKVALL